MKKKVVSILLAAAVLAGTAACGNQSGSKTDGNAGGQTDEQTGDDGNITDAGSDVSLDGDEGKVINIYSCTSLQLFTKIKNTNPSFHSKI
jgi:Ni/Co efflux regulator RcnB